MWQASTSIWRVVSLQYRIFPLRDLTVTWGSGPPRIRSCGTGRWLAGDLSGGLSSVFFAAQQYSSVQMDKLECSQAGNWRASPPTNAPAPPEQQLHSEGSDLLYGPPYSLPFSYHYGHFPLDPHVFSSKKPALPAKFGQPQGSPCEVARFFLSTLPASGECQWHYANPLVPSSPAPAKNLSEPPVNAARHGPVPNYEGGSRLQEGKGRGPAPAAVGGGWKKNLCALGRLRLFLCLSRDYLASYCQSWLHRNEK